ARVAMAPAVRSGDSLIMGRPGVLLSLSSQYGANTLNTTLSVEKRLAEIAPGLQKQGVRMYTGLHRPATFIERALRNLGNSLVIAALLILAVLY
ncbi:efflux RND transporter permease subunit, partial [Shewanella algae]|uniref:efflux RND transporter permease subunit n=1 Tax=Shewanella algae TaxID=38313 RepID=UPI00313DB3D7